MLKNAKLSTRPNPGDYFTLRPWDAPVPSKAAVPRLTLVSRFTILGSEARMPLADFSASFYVVMAPSEAEDTCRAYLPITPEV